jgi:hypothetical protein
MVGARKDSSDILVLWVWLPGEGALLLHGLTIYRNGGNDLLSGLPLTSFIPTNLSRTGSTIVNVGLATAEECVIFNVQTRSHSVLNLYMYTQSVFLPLSCFHTGRVKAVHCV